MRARSTPSSLPAWLLPLALAGCAHYRPRPIDARISAHALLARRLDDPKLVGFLEKMGVNTSMPPGLRTLSLVAVYERPDLKVATANYAATQGGVVAARALPNPVLGIEPTFNATQTLPSPIEVGPVVRFLLGSLGARQAGIEAARDRAATARILIGKAAMTERAHVRDAMLALRAARHEAASARTQARFAGDARGLIAMRAGSGMVSDAVAASAMARAQRATLAAEQADAAVAVDRARLAGAVGMPAAAMEHVRLSFAAFRHPAAPGPRAVLMRRALAHLPAVTAALARYDAADAVLRQAIDEQFPGITIGPGYHYDQGDNKFILSVSLPLPVLNQNQGPIAEARAKRRAAAARFDAAQEAAMSDIDIAWARWRAAGRTAQEAAALARTARRRLAAARVAFAEGASGRLVLVEAEAGNVRAEGDAFRARAARLAALGGLADATGQDFFDPEAR